MLNFCLWTSHLLRGGVCHETQVCVYLQGDDPKQSETGVLHKVPAEDQHTATCRQRKTHVTHTFSNKGSGSNCAEHYRRILWKLNQLQFVQSPRPALYVLSYCSSIRCWVAGGRDTCKTLRWTRSHKNYNQMFVLRRCLCFFNYSSSVQMKWCSQLLTLHILHKAHIKSLP